MTGTTEQHRKEMLDQLSKAWDMYPWLRLVQVIALAARWGHDKPVTDRDRGNM